MTDRASCATPGPPWPTTMPSRCVRTSPSTFQSNSWFRQQPFFQNIIRYLKICHKYVINCQILTKTCLLMSVVSSIFSPPPRWCRHRPPPGRSSSRSPRREPPLGPDPLGSARARPAPTSSCREDKKNTRAEVRKKKMAQDLQLSTWFKKWKWFQNDLTNGELKKPFEKGPNGQKSRSHVQFWLTVFRTSPGFHPHILSQRPPGDQDKPMVRRVVPIKIISQDKPV